MSEDAVLLRDTLETVLAVTETFPLSFYEHLFAAHPEVEAMFQSNSPGAQRKMFARKLVAIVDHLEDPAWLERELPALARSHAGYGVTSEMYDWVGDALIASLRDACGSSWSSAAERAWLAAFSRLSASMIAAVSGGERS